MGTFSWSWQALPEPVPPYLRRLLSASVGFWWFVEHGSYAKLREFLG